MLEKFNRLSQQIDGIQTTMDAFGFDDFLKTIQLLPEKVHILAKKGIPTTHLTNCFVAWVNQTPVIRTGVIDSNVKVNEFLTLVQHVTSLPFRLCSNQLDSIELEWNIIESQHRALIPTRQEAKKGEQIVHLSTELEDFYTEYVAGRKLKTVSEALEKLPKFLNMVGWVDYCAWYNELLEEAFSHFVYDAVDEYALEKSLMDFRHEVFSPFLERTRKHLFMLEQRIETKETKKNKMTTVYQNFVSLKKTLFLIRQDLQRMVKAHHDFLVEIVITIGTIEQQHPELISLKLTGQVLQKLLADEVDAGAERTNWGVKQMLLQLLNDELGVISAVSCAYKFDRAHFAFAIRLAIEQLKQQFSASEVIEMVIHWKELTQTINQFFARRSEGETTKGLKGGSKQVALVMKYREYVLANLLAFCLPITQINKEKTEAGWHEGSRVNLIFLNFIPPYRTISREKNQEEHVALVMYHPNSYEPVGLAEAGHQLMSSLFS